MKIVLLTSLFCLFWNLIQGQNNYQSPLDIPLELAANFGELRPHHFHMGLDFKTKGKEGFNIRSIQDGYVSRIKVNRSGYGKMVQIAHPNGQSSVYAHCQSFKGKIDSLLKSVQYREQNEEVEIYLNPGDIVVKRGQIIAISGNTGGSTAPHLHFELRDTKTEDALNPLLHGFYIADHQVPKMANLKISALTKEGFSIPDKQISYSLKADKNGSYSLPTITLPSNFCDLDSRIGFAIDAIDQFDNSTNRCGIYQAELYVQNQKIFASQLDRVSFSTTRDINCHMDHDEFLKGKDFHRLFVTQENDLKNYSLGDGIYKILRKDSVLVKITLKDAKKNSSTLSFYVKMPKQINSDDTIFLEGVPIPYFDQSFYFPKEEIEVDNLNFTAKFKAHTFYEPIKKSFLENGNWSIGQHRIPLQQSFDLTLKNKPSSQSYLQLNNEKGRRTTENISLVGQMGIVSPSNLGTFSVVEDKNPPKISPAILTGNVLKWTAVDTETDIADYDLYIDGEWQLVEYESKLDLMFYKKPVNLVGMHHFKIILKDDVGNETVWEKELRFE